VPVGTVEKDGCVTEGDLVEAAGVAAPAGSRSGSASKRRCLDELDGFVRRRLRCHIAGRYAKGRWQQILGNELFHALGLFPLATHGPALSPCGLSPTPGDSAPPNPG